MHIMIVNFSLHGLAKSDYAKACEDLAPAFAAIDGLISKHWLANEETNVYGGVYVWKDRQSMLNFQGSEMFHSIGNNPAFTNASVTDFEILENPSKTTGVNL